MVVRCARAAEVCSRTEEVGALRVDVRVVADESAANDARDEELSTGAARDRLEEVETELGAADDDCDGVETAGWTGLPRAVRGGTEVTVREM